MNLKLLKYIAVFVPVLMMSCSDQKDRDLSNNINSNDEANVTFSVMIDDTDFGSRAGSEFPSIGDGSKVDVLIYAIYLDEKVMDENGKETGFHEYTLIDQYGNEKAGQGQCYLNDFRDKIDENGNYSFTLKLARNRDYVLVLWAQNRECNDYETTDFKKVMIKYNGLNNDDKRDAFYTAQHFSVTSETSNTPRSVVLTRPFAQINIGTTEEDFKSEYKYSQITLKGVANQINLLTGKVEDTITDTDAIFKWNYLPAFINFSDDINSTGIPEEKLVVTGSEGEKEYKYLSMCYVLVPDPKANLTGNEGDENTGESEYRIPELESFAIEFSDKKESIGKGVTVANIPVLRNRRTNILGSKTHSIYGDSSSDGQGEISFEIIVPEWDDDDDTINAKW